MKFHAQSHKHYCGIDLHARCLYVCILDHDGTILIHKNIKAKDDKFDSIKMVVFKRGGMFPQAYVYPCEMRATRDLMRRRMHLMLKRSELLAHVHNTNSQYNLPPIARASPNVSLTPVCTKASIWTSASSSSTTTNSARSNGIYKNTPPPVTSTA